MGTAYTPEQLKQLYGEVNVPETNYAEPTSASAAGPDYLSMAQSDVYGRPVVGAGELGAAANAAGYAHGGEIHHFDTGGGALPTQSSAETSNFNFSPEQGADIQSNIKAAAKAFDPGIRPASPLVGHVGAMGTPYHPHALPQYTPPSRVIAQPSDQPAINPRLAAILQSRGMALGMPYGMAEGGGIHNDPNIEGISGLGSLAEGGNPAFKYRGAPEDHHPEFITGTTGHYVQGKGTGQSDEIPAMLADGEYVFDAETVSALGDGSNKAGAEVLNKMREAIRGHKRSAPLDKIPPKAKSPLDYLRIAMKGK